MGLYTCKNCGEDIEIENGQKTVVCDFCGMEQTLPKLDDPKKLELLLEANDRRIRCRFDVAKKMYEQIIQQYPDDNEAYWCKLLCEFGIEYVEDSLTEKNVPTCHRTVTESIFDNADYKFIIGRATAEEKRIYEAEAIEIDRIQKDIIAKAQNAESYDVFICYKETDLESRKRTLDSQYATKIYTRLVNNGYKVFFSRVTLNQMMGSEYEPVIFSALKSAKVMLHVTTSEANTNSPWVRNEWSRYLEFMQEDDGKIIVPCIAKMDPYDLPEELSEFQVAVMTDLDFAENLLRQINSKFGRTPVYGMPYSMPTPPTPPQAPTVNPQIANLVSRAKLFIEDGDWENANKYAENCLDIDCECADAYAVKLMCDFKVNVLHKLVKNGEFLTNRNFVKAMRFASGELKNKLLDIENEYWMDKAELASDNDVFDNEFYLTVTEKLKSLGSYRGADKILSELEAKRNAGKKIGLIVDLIRILEAIPDIGKGEDLQLKLSADKRYYIVKGVVDESIKQCVIPRKYKGIPIKEIASEAFNKCKKLESVEIGENVTTIGSRAFYNCSMLNSIIIPASVTSIGNCAFFKSIYLTIYCEAESKPSGWDNNWFSGQSGIWGYGGEKGETNDGWRWCLTLPDNALTIARYTGDDDLQVNIPTTINGRTVTGIGSGAFAHRLNVTSVTIPDSVTSIGSCAFAYCSSIKNITFGEKSRLEKIEYRAFYGCHSITSIKIPNSVAIIGKEVFGNCDKLIIYSEATSRPSGWYSMETYLKRPFVWDCKNNNVADNGYMYGITVGGINYAIKDNTAKVVGTNISGDIAIPKTILYKSKQYSVTAIGDRAFAHCDITSIKIPDSIVNIENFAFYSCEALTSVEIPNSVTSIGCYTFSGCNNLTAIKIPRSVTNMRNWAFSYCSKLTIYCEVASKPSGWDNDWNYSNNLVIWGYKN